MLNDYYWIPACGRTETPMKYRGKTYLYMWNALSREHAYYCFEDDLFMERDWEMN